MANRVVNVMLRADIGQYVAGMSRAAGSTAALGSTVDGTTRSTARGLGSIGTAGLVAGGLVAAGFASAINKSMDFEASMSGVAAASGQTGAALADLRDEAMRAGAATQYSATEAADAITEMSKAGVSAADIMGGGLDGALSLAAAGQIAVADAASIASVAMTQFNLAGEDLPHVADLLAAGAGKALGSVDDLGQALNQAGLVASAAGLSIEETTGGLAAFASAGLIGSDAGTSFKSMLAALQGPSGTAAETMAEFGINMYDANGNMLGLSEMAGVLQSQLGGLTEEQRNSALATIFGTDAVRAANVLYREGESGINAWTTAVNDQGYAADQAAALNDNLRGDLEKLGGAFDTLMISIGSGAQEPLRQLTQGLTGLLDIAGGAIEFFTALPGPVQLAVGAFAAWAALGGTITEVLGPLKESASGFFESFGEALGEARENGDGLSEVMGSVGEVAWDSARGGLKALAKAIGPELAAAAATYVITDIIGDIQSMATAGSTAADRIDGLRVSLDEADGNGTRFETANAGLEELRTQLDAAQAVIDEHNSHGYIYQITVGQFSGPDSDELVDAKRSVEQYTAAIEEQEAAQGRAERSTELLGARYNMTTAEVQAFADEHGINLSGSLRIAQTDFIRLADAAGIAATSVGVVGDAAGTTGYENFATYAAALGLSEDATEALRDQTDELGSTLADFVEPLGAYTGLIDAKKEAERESAQATADATTSQSDSWEDYVGDVSVSIDEYLAQLEEQVAAQDNWQTNMLTLSARVSQGTIDELARMGPEGAPLVAQLVNASDEELARMETVFGQRAADATSEWGLTLTQAQPVLSQIAATAGLGVAQSLAAQLSAGTTSIAEIARQYGIVLADGVNPVLRGLGKPALEIQRGARADQSTGGYADGGPIFGPGTGTSDSIPAWLSNGEYVIRASSVDKYGIDLLDNINQGRAAFAAGGFVSADSVPKPSSTAPFGPPLSSGADASMGAGYDAVVKFLSENALADAGFVGSGKASPNGVKGLGPRAAAARAYVMEAFGISNIGGYANRNIAGTGTVSDHALGKAIDVMIGNYKSQAGIAQGNSVASYFINNPDAYGTKYVIWRDQINQGGGWKPYGHPGGGRSDTLQHRDHVHVSFYNQGGLVDGMPQYKQGTPFVPNDGPAYLHKGEAVVPAYANGGMVRAEDGSMVSSSFYDNLGQGIYKAANGELARASNWKSWQQDAAGKWYDPSSREFSGAASAGSSSLSADALADGLQITGTVAFDPSKGLIQFVDARVFGSQLAATRMLSAQGAR